MKFPFVSRDRYETEMTRADRREVEYRERIVKLEERLLSLVDRVTDLAIETSKPTPPPQLEKGYALPPSVLEAIRTRAPKGSSTEGMLRTWAENRLKNGETEPKDVAQEILAGSDAFAEEQW